MKEKKPLNIEIGNRIRIVREKNHLTQAKLAEILDLTTQFISDLERGVVGASFPTVIDLCNKLHVSSDYVLMGVDDSGISDIILELQDLDSQQLNMVRRAIHVYKEALEYHASGNQQPDPGQEPEEKPDPEQPEER